MRFDEVELEAVVPLEPLEVETPRSSSPSAPHFFRHLLALLTDLSLFAALALALSPLLHEPATRTHLAALAGFVVMVSYYYFAGAWVLWGKTIGGAIFDVRVAARSIAAASARWAWMAAALLLATAATYVAL